MSWTVSNLVIQMASGIFGALGVASVLAEHRFGFVGHTLTGLIGGILGGCFLQQLAVTMVTASGSLNEPTVAENLALQIIAGAASGGCAMLIAGLAKHAADEHRRKAGKPCRTSPFITTPPAARRETRSRSSAMPALSPASLSI